MKRSYILIYFLVLFLGFDFSKLYSQTINNLPSPCMDYGVGVDGDPYMFIDFFKTAGGWTPSKQGAAIGDTLLDRYKIHGDANALIDQFKIVNGSYAQLNIDPANNIHGNCNFISFWDMMMDQGKVLSNGYPTSLPLTIYPYKRKSIDPNQGTDNLKPIIVGSVSRAINSIPEGAPVDGWILRWKGKGTFSMDGLSKVTITSGNQTLMNASAGSGNTYTFISSSTGGGKATVSYQYFPHEYGRQLKIVSSDVNDPIHDIEFIYPGMESILDAGQNINPRFIEKVKQFKVLRYMNYMHANFNPERRYVVESHPYYYSNFLKDMSWSERTTAQWYQVNATHEYIIEISNLTKTSPWVNIPYCAGKDYVENLTKFYMDRLNPDLQLYLEVGNEVWNFSGGGYDDNLCAWQPGFNGYYYFKAYSDYYYPGSDWDRGFGVRIKELYQSVTAVAGPSNKDRLVRVIGVQTSWADVAESLVNSVGKENWDALAITWYYGLDGVTQTNCMSPDNKHWRGWLYDWWTANPNDSAGFNKKYREAVLSEFRCNSYLIKEQARRAKVYGKKFVTYEGGDAVIGGASNGPTNNALPGEINFDATARYPENFTDSDFLHALILADQSSETDLIFDEIIDTLRANGASLINHFGLDGRSTAYGVWNLFPQTDMDESIDYIKANYPKYKNFSEKAETENCNQLLVNLPSISVGAGLAIKFDGLDDYIKADNISYMPDESTDYSMEAWVQPYLSGSRNYLLTFNNLSNPSDINGIYIREDGKAVWEIKSGNSSLNLVSSISISPMKWYHIAGTKKGNRYTLYINGTNTSSTNATIAVSTKNKFSIGALLNTSGIVNPFKGEIDELRIWNVGRSKEEIRAYMCQKISKENFPVGLKAYLRFDDGANSVATANLIDSTKYGTLINIGFSARSGYTVSGAPLGDSSSYSYLDNGLGQTFSFRHSNGDVIGLNNIGPGNPDGVHVYFVNDAPYFKEVPLHYDGLGLKKYFGVFTVNGVDPTYDLTYQYEGNPDAAGASENNLRLIKRDNASLQLWKHSGAKKDKVLHSFNLLCREKYRAEYDLGFRPDNAILRPGSGKALYYNTSVIDGNAKGVSYGLPPFVDYTITGWARGWGQFCVLGNSELEARGGGSRIEGAEFGPGFNFSPNTDSTTWYHYAYVRKGTHLTKYINGQIISQSDAAGPLQPGIEGRDVFNMVTLMSPPTWFGGGNSSMTLDEFTLWNVALDSITIRDWMCKKITGKHPYSCKNLLLYFNFDEGQGLTLEDKNGSSDMEFVPGYYKYVASGAAVGDESMHDYVTPADISFTHPNGDFMEAKLKTGSPIGVHLYRVDNMKPITSTISDQSVVSMDSSRYWGIYVHSPAGVSKYDLTYHYQGNAQIKDETTLRLLDRFDNAAPVWINPSTETVSNSAKTILLPDQARGEYILGGTSPSTFEFKVPAKPIFLSELPSINAKIICGNSTGLIYKVKKDLTVVSYKWIIPEELNGFSISDSIVLSAAYTGATAINVTLSVIAINGTGKSVAADYTITINPEPSMADAGPDQLILPPATSSIMDGNIPGANEIGTWAIKKGNGSLASATDPKTTVTNLPAGKNIFIWTIKQKTGTCPASSDSVNIILAPPPIDIISSDDTPLPQFVCGGTNISVKAIPADGITPTGYIWDLPNDFTLLNQSGSSALIQAASRGAGGTIKVKAVYGNNSSASPAFESTYISIRQQPNKPVFDNPPSEICFGTTTTIRAVSDPTISNYEWTLPFGITPTKFPRSTTTEIEVKIDKVVEGYISLHSFNGGCSSAEAADSFKVIIRKAPAQPYAFYQGGFWGSQACQGEVIYAVNEPDSNVTYIWEWTDRRVKLIEYLGPDNSVAKFDMSGVFDGVYGTINVAAKLKGSNSACSMSEWFGHSEYASDFKGSKPDSISIYAPIGQDPTTMQVGQTYTLKTSCSTCPKGNFNGLPIWSNNYVWSVPDGMEVLPSSNRFDSTITVKVDKPIDGPIRVWAIILQGCAGASDSLIVSTPGTVPAPVYVSGKTVICNGDSLNIKVKDVNADEYIWQLPDGSTPIKTKLPLLTLVVTKAMKGDLLVKARKGTFISEATKIFLFVKASSLAPLTFYNVNNEVITSLQACAPLTWDEHITVKTSNNLADHFSWDRRPAVAINFDNYPYTDTDTVRYFLQPNWLLLPPPGKNEGYIYVTSYSGCSKDSIVDSLYYAYAVPPQQQQPVFRNSPTEVCVGSTVTYTIDPIANASSYRWTLPEGISAIELITSVPQITVNVSNGQGGKISVYATSNACTKGNTAVGYTDSIRIFGEPVDFKFLDTPQAGCVGETLSFKVSDAGSTQYNWQVPAGLGKDTIGGTEMNFKVKNNQGGAVQVSFKSTTCPVPYIISTLNINLSGEIKDPVFSSQINSICPGITYTYTSTDIGADSYNWILPPGWKIGNQTDTVKGEGRSVEVIAGSLTAAVKIGVYGTLICGNKLNASKTVYTNAINVKLNCAPLVAAPVFTEEHSTICSGQLTEYKVNEVADAQSYQWNLPAGLYEYAKGDSGIVKTTTNFISVKGNTAGKKGYIKVKVITANAESQEASTSSEISVLSPVTEITLSGNSTICEGDSVKLSSSASSGNQWYKDGALLTGEISQSYQAKISGNYNLIITDGSCLSDSSGKGQIINVTPQLHSVITASGNTNLCEGDSVILNSSVETGNQWYKNGQMIDGKVSKDLQVNSSGFYNVIYTSGTCISDSTEAGQLVSVQTKPKGDIVLAGDIKFCDGDSVILSSSSDDGNQWYKDGQMVTDGSGKNYTVKSSGYYNLVVSAGTCLSDSVGKGIMLTNISIDKALELNAKDVCKDSPGLLTISRSENNVRYNIFVNDFSIDTTLGTGSDLDVTIPAASLNQNVNTIRVEGSKGECPAEKLDLTKNIAVKSIIPNLIVTGGSACYKQDGMVTINSSQKGVTYEAFINNVSIGSVAGTDLDVTITVPANKLSMNGDIVNINASGFGCTIQKLADTAMVKSKAEVAKPGQISGPSEICQNDEAVFSVNAASGNSYTWGFPKQAEELTLYNNDSTIAMLKLKFNDSISGIGYVTVRAKQGNCQSDTSRLQVKTKLNCNEIFIPNIITPNSADNNGNWTINGIQNYPNAEITIMNRWGSLVWHSIGYSKAWNGNSKNNDELPTGTYYYIINLQNSGSNQKKNNIYNGSVTIMR